MEPAIVTVQLTLADIKSFSKFAQGKQNSKGLILILIAAMLFGVSYILGDHGHHGETAQSGSPSFGGVWMVMGPFLLFVAVLGFFFWRAQRPSNYQKFAPGIFLPNTYTVFDEGLFCQNERGETLNYWKIVFRFVETRDHFFVMLAERNGHILPKRCFPTLEAAALFANQVRLHLEKHAPAALAAK